MSNESRVGERVPVRISIAMATYNGERYIQEQLDSLARQTLFPAELVVTDDGSTDRTLSILEAFSAGAPFPVRIFRNSTRLGYEDNFLKAASLCTGDLLAFCDQDDIWLEQKLSLCSKYFSDPRIEGVLHSGQTLLHTGERGKLHPNFPRTKVWEAGEFDPFSGVPGYAIVIRRDLLDLVDNTVRPMRLKSHDNWSWLLASSAGRVVTLAEVLVLYRQHGANVFGVPSRLTLAAAIRASTGVHEFIEEADSESFSARTLEAAARQDPNRATALLHSARKLRYRSTLHWIRTSMYGERSSFFARAAKFSRLALMGGYFPDRSRARLGPKCGAKDVLLGVSGVYKMFPPSRVASDTPVGR
jgi:glycosyltransferase involved in cell wall biosynthesis